MSRLAGLALTLLTLLAACETSRRSVSVLGDFDFTQAEATRAWLVEDGNEVLGELVRYDDFAGTRFFYSVRNPLHQEFGLIDAMGRAYRYRAHQPEASWIGSGSVLAGVQKILSASEDAQLREVELSELLRR